MALRLLVTGTGKDGTNSLCELIRRAFDLNGAPCRIAHEPDVLQILSAHTRYLESRDPACREEIAAIIRAWPFDVVVSGGFDFCLDVFHREVGPGLKIIHLKRRRDAYLRSVLNATLANPETHGYYLEGGPFRLYRPAAFHYSELTRTEWDALTVEERYGWLYDKVHRLFDEWSAWFNETILVETETLSDPAVIRHILTFIEPRWTKCPPPVHRNAMRIVDHRDFPIAQRKRLHALFVGFDIERLMESPLYAVNYFLQFVDRSGAQSAGDEELHRFFEKAEELRKLAVS